jgi:hypothetical protein
MRKILFVLLAFTFTATTFAQIVQPLRHKIAVFAPLYLDSAFNGYSYRYEKTFPKFLNPGLEFYQGAQMALDSLQKKGAPLEVYIYDSRSLRSPVAQQINSFEMQDVEMIIANANSAEVKTLADEAQRRQIPFISATLPNDGGVFNNPYFVVLNSTLRTHCEGIYHYLQKYHGQDRIVMFRKDGVQENQMLEYFNEITRTTSSVPLRIEFVDIGNDFSINSLTKKLDSTRRNVCIAGSLDQRFGLKLAKELASVSEIYPQTIVGMPTWEDIKDFTRQEYKNVEILYTTPFHYSRSGGLGGQLTYHFESIINSRPTDMFYRGYEVMLRFALLLLDAKKDVASSLTRKGNIVFTQFDIQPVFLNKSNMTLDYFENKHLYFIKYINGIQTVVN